MGRDLLRSQNDLISSPFGQGQLLVQGGLPIANGIISSGGELSAALTPRGQVITQCREGDCWKHAFARSRIAGAFACCASRLI